MITPVVLHEDAFYEYFKPYRHPDACHDIWGGLGLETFGKDLDTVRKLDVSYLWTVVEGGSSNDQWITPGYEWHLLKLFWIAMRPDVFTCNRTWLG